MNKEQKEKFEDIIGEKHYLICEGKKCECYKEIKQFISTIKEETRQEILGEIEKMGSPINSVDGLKRADILIEVINKIKTLTKP